MNTRTGISARGRRLCDGVSLVEMMIALAVGSVIMLAITMLFVSSHRSRVAIQQSAQQLESAFMGVQALQEDLRLAGFLGELDRGQLPSIATMPNMCETSLAGLATNMPMYIQGLDNVTSATKPSCIAEAVVEGTDIVAIRRAGTCIPGASDCEDVSISGQQYLQVSACSTDIVTYGATDGMYRLLDDPASSDFYLHSNCPPGTAITAVPLAPLRRLKTRIFYVAANNSGSDGIPTLKRIDLNGATWTVTAISEGIQDLQVQYGLDTSGDGVVDSFTSTPATIADWLAAVKVKVFLLGRNLQQTAGYTDDKTYVLGDKSVVSPSDGYKRHVIANEVILANPAGRTEQ